MKLRTSEDLVDYLDKELVWRKRELAILFSLIDRNRQNQKKTDAMLRSTLVVLYAHWEGFIKAAGTAYLGHIADQGFRYRDLALPLRALAISERIQSISSPKSTKVEELIDVLDFLLNRQHEKCSIVWKKMIRTKGVIINTQNLKYEVLRDILLALGLDCSCYETKKNLIDYSLLSRRNAIAHGTREYLSYDEFEELYREVLGLMELFKNQVENAAIMEDYKL